MSGNGKIGGFSININTTDSVGGRLGTTYILLYKSSCKISKIWIGFVGGKLLKYLNHVLYLSLGNTTQILFYPGPAESSGRN